LAKLTVADLQQMKREGRKIAEALVFDTTMTRVFERAGAEVLLVGDSYTGYLLGGGEASVEGMILFAGAVVRAAERALVTVDLPGPVCEAGADEVLKTTRRFKQETGADLAKIDIPSTDDGLIDELQAVLEGGLAADVRVRFRPERARDQGIAAEHDQVMKLAHAAEDAGASLIELYEATPELYRDAARSLRVPVLGGRWVTQDADGKIFIYPNLVGYRPDAVDRTDGPSAARFIYDLVEPFLSEVHAGKWEAADQTLHAQNRAFPP
jgi:3-methyl-2-oxobutanoate hydroxymethyltransferase